MFGLKDPYFLPNIATTLSKNDDFANKIKKKFQKTLFFLSGQAFTPPPLSGRATKKRTFFAASLMNTKIPEKFIF